MLDEEALARWEGDGGATAAGPETGIAPTDERTSPRALYRIQEEPPYGSH